MSPNSGRAPKQTPAAVSGPSSPGCSFCWRGKRTGSLKWPKRRNLRKMTNTCAAPLLLVHWCPLCASALHSDWSNKERVESQKKCLQMQEVEALHWVISGVKQVDWKRSVTCWRSYMEAFRLVCASKNTVIEVYCSMEKRLDIYSFLKWLQRSVG